MRKVMKKVLPVLAGVLMLFAVSACTGLDVVLEDSLRAFGVVIETLPPEKNGDVWVLSAPDGDAEFRWTEETVAIRVNEQPFIDAGLDITQTAVRGGSGWIIFYTQRLGDMENNYEPIEDPLPAFRNIATAMSHSGNIGYHTALDHYNISINDGRDDSGNMFEWAKDLSTNGTTGENQDKDIVFVLNPEPFIAAGVDPDKVEGWVFTKVTVDIDGKATEVDKFLKAFDLK